MQSAFKWALESCYFVGFGRRLAQLFAKNFYICLGGLSTQNIFRVD